MTGTDTKKRVRSRNGTDKRDELLKAASKFFLKYGYDGGSINALARSSGISKESIYRYFKSKAHLFEAVIDKELEAYQQGLASLTSDVQAPVSADALVATAETMLTVLTSERTQAMRRLIFQAVTRTPEIGKHYYEIGPEQTYGKLEKYFAGIERKEGFTPHFLSRAFVALLLHEIMLQRECGLLKTPSKPYLNKRATQVAEQFARAYLK